MNAWQAVNADLTGNQVFILLPITRLLKAKALISSGKTSKYEEVSKDFITDHKAKSV